MRSFLGCLLLALSACCVSTGSCQTATDVKNYDECVNAGGRIEKSLPPRCVDNRGNSWVREDKTFINREKKLCVDRCGNKSCEEIVCQGEGCPCAESASNCPSDC